jgi:hypothetical protein
MDPTIQENNETLIEITGENITPNIEQDTVEQDTIEQDTIEQDTIEQDTIEQDTIEQDTVELPSTSTYIEGNTNLFSTNSLPPLNNLTGFLSASLLSEMSGNNHPLTPPPAPHIQNYFSTASYTPLPIQNVFSTPYSTSTTSLPNINIPQLSIPENSPFIFQGTLSSNTNTNLEGFSPEEIENSDEADTADMPELIDENNEVVDDSDDESISSSDDVDIRRATTLLRLRQLRSLPENKVALGITWEFELNYDWYRYKSMRYFSDCRSRRFLTFKNSIDELQEKKNITYGKYWLLDKPKTNIKIHFVYFIIYFDITKSHIDFEFYGIFEEELNETKIIKQLIEMGIFGSTGRMHESSMTSTDGIGFNLLKVDYCNW